MNSYLSGSILAQMESCGRDFSIPNSRLHSYNFFQPEHFWNINYKKCVFILLLTQLFHRYMHWNVTWSVSYFILSKKSVQSYSFSLLLIFFFWQMTMFCKHSGLKKKAYFKGDWEMATHDISITVRETIWGGGMHQCFHATIRRFPSQYTVEATHSWVAKFYKKEVPGCSNTSSG